MTKIYKILALSTLTSLLLLPISAFATSNPYSNEFQHNFIMTSAVNPDLCTKTLDGYSCDKLHKSMPEGDLSWIMDLRDISCKVDGKNWSCHIGRQYIANIDTKTLKANIISNGSAQMNWN